MPYSFQERELPHTALDMLSPSAPLLPSPFNIILFGSTGCGKSSIVNIVTIKRQEYCLYDTTGLDEGTVGTVVSKDALVKLYHLLHDLQGGISLLVYCMWGSRITETLEQNYNIFYDGFCRKAVPIVIVVTGLEDLHHRHTWKKDEKWRIQEPGRVQ
ncbi:MAG: hypothetical protein NXY57DRAFT_1036920 [Lentinula lateritia]|nr:MAG: hypothetical protein NXY57DRAFT_1036920 [Lentinula lateritia]